MARIIVDAGPLIAFAKVGQLAVLQHLFNSIEVALSVQRECLSKPCAEHEPLRDMLSFDWVDVRQPKSRQVHLSRSLGGGECDSIWLALEDQAGSLLVMDDYLARRQAVRLNLPMIGSVRVLDIAEQRGVISSAEELIADMRAHGYRINPDILARIRSEK